MKNSPSKLFKLKQWLTLPEAAKHLSGICGEEVTVADILRLALDKHLKLSVYFVNNTRARPGQIVGCDDVEWYEIPPEHIPHRVNIPDEAKGMPLTCTVSLNIYDDKYLKLEDNVITIEGVWDLPMLGGEQLDIEHFWQQLTGGPEVTLHCLEGAFVEKQSDIIYQLQESFDQNEFSEGSKAQLEHLKKKIIIENINKEKAEEIIKQHQEERKKYLEKKALKNHTNDYYPASGLPEDSILVVRTDALRKFEQLISDNDQDKEISTKTHKNTELNAKKREQILGAALSVLASWPNECKSNSGKIQATKIRELIENKGYIFWREDGTPPLSTSEIEKLIREWLKKTGE